MFRSIHSKQLNYLDTISNNVSQCMTSLLKPEITVSFLAFIASSFRVTEEDQLSETDLSRPSFF